MFSFPLNPKLSEKEFTEVIIPFLKKHKNLISDIYFTSRIPPFANDAMGDNFLNTSNLSGLFENALFLQKNIEIPVSATFNNIYIHPKLENLNKFIRNFEPFYEMGVRIATIPFTSWVMTGQLQYEFPELKIKNTILQSIRNSQEVWNLCEAGFDYINLERTLMRNRDELLKIIKARTKFYNETGKYVELSLLANENCLGWCPIMNEHYSYNSQRSTEDSQFFYSSLSNVSCSKWDYEISGVELKSANIPPWRDDWDEFIGLGIDVFKLHGRENKDKMYHSMNIIQNYANNEEILYNDFENYSEDIKDKLITKWREKIKNCKNECWDCRYCDQIVKHESELRNSIKNINNKIHVSNLYDSKCTEKTFTIPSFTSEKILCLLNNLIETSKIHLEVGTLLGGTFRAALENNNTIGIAIDNWKINELKPIQPHHPIIFSDRMKKECEINLADLKNEKYLLELDIEKIDESHITELINGEKIESFFYDGPMEFKYLKHIFRKLNKVFSDKLLFILDDAKNEKMIKEFEYYIQMNWNMVYSKLIIGSEIEDSESWWNGVGIYYLTRR